MKKKLAFLLCMTLTLCSTSGAVLAAESEQDADPASALISAADMPPSVSAYPAEVRTSEENGVYHLEKVYYLTAKDDPSTIPTADFEREGRTYTLLDMLKNDQTETDTREHIEVVTLDSKTKDMAEILKMLEPKLEVKTEDGYEGILSLDHTTIQVEAAGYSTSSRTVTAERTYPNLSDADVSLIPKTVNENGRILIHKTSSTTDEGIYGVPFILYDGNHNPIAQEESDNEGYVRFEGLSAGRFYLRELENEGYVPDAQEKTVYVKDGETTLVEWQNTPITGQIQVLKTSEDYNSMNGWPAGTPIPDTELEIYNARTNRLVDTIKADKNGLAVSKPLPLGRYKIVESKAGKFYGLDKTPIEVEIEYAGQIVKVSMTNRSLSTNVSIKKTGPSQAVSGQPIRYVFSQIKNGSNVSLDSFYWRDQIPAQITLNKIVTGSYNQQQNYKVVYKTNLSEDYRTLADNLSTSKVYVLDARPAVLSLAANERVTEIMFVFSNVRAGFAQVETPYIYATARSGLANNSSIVNVADVGGLYDGQWIQAVSRWLTTIYAKTTVRLPKTGY